MPLEPLEFGITQDLRDFDDARGTYTSQPTGGPRIQEIEIQLLLNNFTII